MVTILQYTNIIHWIRQESNPTIKLTIFNDGSSWKMTAGLIPEVHGLDLNYPNSFNPSTTFRVALPKDSRVSLVIYDVMGREVINLVNGEMPAGYHNLVWDGKDRTGRDVSSGAFLYRLNAHSLIDEETFGKTGKMVLLR